MESIQRPTISHSSEPEGLWDERDVATYLKKSVRSIQGFRYQGGGPRFIKIGKSVRYRPADVLAWIEANGICSTSATSGRSA